MPPLPGSSPSVDSGQPEPVLALRAEAQVAGERHLETAAERVAADLRDEDLGDRRDRAEHLVRPAHHVHVRVGRVRHEGLDVGAGREEAIEAAAHDDDLDVVVAGGLVNGRAELLDERHVVGVGGRVRQRDEADAGVLGELDGHYPSPPTTTDLSSV